MVFEIILPAVGRLPSALSWLHCLRNRTARGTLFRGPVMPRVARRRLWTPAACYYVLNRGHARETIFHDDDDRVCFLRLLTRYRDRFGFRLFHYCPMGNHFHLLLQLPDARELSRLLAGLLVAYWHPYRRRYALVGHLFQGRCKSPAVEAEAGLLSWQRKGQRKGKEKGTRIVFA